MSPCRKFLDAYSSRRPTLSIRTASPLALVLHHLILDMLTRLRRRTSPTHPYPTVTYGEWYDFHDVSSLMSTSPSLTFKVSFCLMCRVHQSHHIYTGPPHRMAVSPKGSLIFFNALRGRLQCSPKSFKWSPVSNELCISLEWHTDPKT